MNTLHQVFTHQKMTHDKVGAGAYPACGIRVIFAIIVASYRCAGTPLPFLLECFVPCRQLTCPAIVVQKVIQLAHICGHKLGD
jgi:hypothetical protein